MHPDKVRRDRLERLEDLPNIGPAMARDLRHLCIETPADLIGCNPRELYERLSRLTGVRQDPCVFDVFLSVVRFMEGAPARPWWAYTEERRGILAADQGDESGQQG